MHTTSSASSGILKAGQDAPTQPGLFLHSISVLPIDFPSARPRYSPRTGVLLLEGIDKPLAGELEMPVLPTYLPNSENERMEILTKITAVAATLYGPGKFHNAADAVDTAFILYNEVATRMDEHAKQNKGSGRFGF